MTQPSLDHTLHQLDLLMACSEPVLPSTALLSEMERIDAAVQQAARHLHLAPWGLARLLPSLSELARQRRRCWQELTAAGAEQAVGWLRLPQAVSTTQPPSVEAPEQLVREHAPQVLSAQQSPEGLGSDADAMAAENEAADATDTTESGAVTTAVAAAEQSTPEVQRVVAGESEATELVVRSEQDQVTAEALLAQEPTEPTKPREVGAQEPATTSDSETPEEPPIGVITPLWTVARQPVSPAEIQKFATLFRGRKLALAATAREQAPLLSVREAIVREVLEALGPVPASVKGPERIRLRERLEQVSSEDWLRRWQELDEALRVDLLTLLIALARALQDAGQDNSGWIIARLSAYSQREQPGFTHGLARKHIPRHGSWLADARHAELTLRQWLGDKTTCRTPAASVAPPTAKPTGEDEPDEPADDLLLEPDWAWWSQVRSKRVVLVGGSPREPYRQRLLQAFAFSSLDWVDGHVRRIEKLARKVAHRSLDLVLVVSQFISHKTSNKIVDACKQHGVPFAVIERGHGVLAVRRAIERFVACQGPT